MLGRLLRAWAKPVKEPSRLNEQGIDDWHAGDLASATQKFRKALRLKPDYAAACSNLGMVLVEQRLFTEGLDCLRRAVDMDAGHAGARINLANVLAVDGQVELALEHFEAALRIDPGNVLARLNYLKPSMDVCRWDVVEAESRRLSMLPLDKVADWCEVVQPFVSLLLPLSAPVQLAVARSQADKLARRYRHLQPSIAALRPRGSAGDRIRIAYLSGDFRNNAVAHQTAGMFPLHDRTSFEVFAYSWGADDGSEWRRRIESGCDHFIDIQRETFEQSAARIARDGIDVAVNLSGYGGSSRNEIFALRPAALQIQWLGYPGSMGADFIDYVLADDVVLPRSMENRFSEAIARLPGCYQVNDDRQAISDPAPTRAESGLPEDAFVFCSFNQSYKVDRAVFSCWMRLLSAHPGSVLWLLVSSPEARKNLCAAAWKEGVDVERIVFASPLPKARHLARHRLADLFLDTWLINGGTTASDALWTGLPMVTLAGESFGSRVAASLLSSLGLHELIAHSCDQYERIANDLAGDAPGYQQLRDRLARAVKTGPLFDTAQFVRNFEAAIKMMVARHRSGLPPASFGPGI